MAVAYSGFALDSLKGPYQGFGSPTNAPLHLFRTSILVTGTYATGGATVDLCQAFTGTTAQVTGYGARMGVTALSVLWARAFGDYYDGTNVYDVDNSSIALTTGGTVTPISAASTNNLCLVKLFSGVNGSGGSEITNATAVSGWFGLVFAATITVGSLGTV
jgi:hypothetical protein